MYEKEKSELERICHLLYERNLAAACDGNISLRVSREHILLTPSGKNKGLVTADDMILLDLEGNVVEGKGKASKEYPMHQIIYKRREEVRAVVHTHPVYATAFALAGKKLPDNYLIEMKMMLKGTALAEYAAPGTIEMALAVEPFLNDYDAILLKNHGAVTYGKSLIDAYNKMEVMESIAKTIIMSKVLGEPELISAENMEKMEKQKKGTEM